MSKLNSSSKSDVSRQSSFPTTGTLCFAVNVTGDGIPVIKKACRPDLGITSNFVNPGQTLTVEVPSGSNRKFEAFLYYSSTAGQDCPLRDPDGFYPQLSASQIYSVGQVEGIQLENEIENVTIEIAYPGDSSTVASSYGASCTTTTPPANNVGSGTNYFGRNIGSISGANLKLKYSLGAALNAQTLSSSSLKVKVH